MVRLGHILCVLLAAGACAGETEDTSASGEAANLHADSSTNDAGAEGLVDTEEAAPAFGPEVGGLRLKRSIVVRARPSLEAENLGTAAAHTVLAWKGAVKAEGCDSRWIEIEPRGWICEGYLEPVAESPRGVELPKLGPGERVPGVYGKVVDEGAMLLTLENDRVVDASPILLSATVRQRGRRFIAGKAHWLVDGGKYIAESALRMHDPSSFQGVRLQGTEPRSLPVGFAISGRRPGDWVVVKDAPAGERVRRLPPRAVVDILEVERDGDGQALAYQIGEGEYIDAADLRVAFATPPPEATLPGERWVDVDLSSQVLVAYEGELPIYATLISSGTRKNPTETGIFRVWIKFSETDMSGRMGASDAYSVATVPWTQFYENDFALHSSYWHDGFGQARSHGCVNLSPRDSRFLYFWTDPQVPRGWSMANASSETPGSMVRVRSDDDPDPEFKGEALRVYQARAH